MYYLKFENGDKCPWTLGKILCVGRNYAAHAKELNNPIPSAPIVFLKPSTSAVPLDQPFSIPNNQGEVHHELELALLIGQPLSNCDEETGRNAVVGIGLALDLTLRDVQNRLKEKGHPWEVAKAFDGACPMTPFKPVQGLPDHHDLMFTLERNGKVQQHGRTGDMIFNIGQLLSFMSKHFTLNPGDVVLTGTPAGVGPLVSGDQLKVRLNDSLEYQSQVL